MSAVSPPLTGDEPRFRVHHGHRYTVYQEYKTCARTILNFGICRLHDDITMRTHVPQALKCRQMTAALTDERTLGASQETAILASKHVGIGTEKFSCFILFQTVPGHCLRQSDYRPRQTYKHRTGGKSVYHMNFVPSKNW